MEATLIEMKIDCPHCGHTVLYYEYANVDNRLDTRPLHCAICNREFVIDKSCVIVDDDKKCAELGEVRQSYESLEQDLNELKDKERRYKKIIEILLDKLM